jgi:hypothetical protein
MPAAFDNQ